MTDYIEDGGPMLAICGGYQLLGKYYIGANGERIEGISALDHYTKSQDNNRFIGDIVIENEETGQKYHGFENHNGVTYLGKDERPLEKSSVATVITAKIKVKVRSIRMFTVLTSMARS